MKQCYQELTTLNLVLTFLVFRTTLNLFLINESPNVPDLLKEHCGSSDFVPPLTNLYLEDTPETLCVERACSLVLFVTVHCVDIETTGCRSELVLTFDRDTGADVNVDAIYVYLDELEAAVVTLELFLTNLNFGSNIGFDEDFLMF